MSEVKLDERYILRVKRGSEVDRVLQAFEELGEPTEEQLKDASGNHRGGWLARQLGDWFENIAVIKPWGEDKHKLQYTNIMPSQVTIRESSVTMDGDGQRAQSGADKDIYVWPEAPPVPGSLGDAFDVPDWFAEFEVMVEDGMHYSFEGPPSVGKDTAVEELAAKKRKPLVKIGGSGGFRKRDLTGGYADLGVFQVGEYVAAAINGWWVQLSEVNAADPDALMYINTQLAPPNIVTFNGRAYPVHPDFRIFITYNHNLVGTKPLPPAFKDRFESRKVPFFTTKYQLRRRLVAMGMPDDELEEVVVEEGKDAWGNVQNKEYIKLGWNDIIVMFGLAMWDAHERGQMRYQVTTRRLISASRKMLLIEGMTIERALEGSVIQAIDSPVERKAAEQVLQNVLEERKVKVD